MDDRSHTQAGAMPIDTHAVLAHVMSTWNRQMPWILLMPWSTTLCCLLMESYEKAQKAQKEGHETKLDMWK